MEKFISYVQYRAMHKLTIGLVAGVATFLLAATFAIPSITELHETFLIAVTFVFVSSTVALSIYIARPVIAYLLIKKLRKEKMLAWQPTGTEWMIIFPTLVSLATLVVTIFSIPGGQLPWWIIVGLWFAINTLSTVVEWNGMQVEFKYLYDPSPMYKNNLIWISTYMNVIGMEEPARLYLYNQIDHTDDSANLKHIELHNSSCTNAAKVDNLLRNL